MAGALSAMAACGTAMLDETLGIHHDNRPCRRGGCASLTHHVATCFVVAVARRFRTGLRAHCNVSTGKPLKDLMDEDSGAVAAMAIEQVELACVPPTC